MPLAGSIVGDTGHSVQNPDLTEEWRRTSQFSCVLQLRLNVDFPQGNTKSLWQKEKPDLNGSLVLWSLGGHQVTS